MTGVLLIDILLIMGIAWFSFGMIFVISKIFLG